MTKPKDRDIPVALATVFAAAALAALSATNASACLNSALAIDAYEAIERCRKEIADDTERLNQASGWLAHLEADAKTKPYLDPVDQSQLQEAKNDVATKSLHLENDKRDLDEMEHPKPPKPPPVPTPEEQAAAKAAQAESAAREAEQERQRKLAACNNKPTSLGVLFCRWGI